MSEPEFLLITEAAEMIRTPVATLYRWRHEGTGPPASKVGRKLLYPRSGLLKWVDEQASDLRADPRKRVAS